MYIKEGGLHLNILAVKHNTAKKVSGCVLFNRTECCRQHCLKFVEKQVTATHVKSLTSLKCVVCCC